MISKCLKHLIFLAFAVSSISCSSKENITNDLKLAIKNISTSSSFIAIEVSCGKDTFPILIGNNILYLIVRDEGLIKSEEEYFDLMIEKIIKKKIIVIRKTDDEILKSYSVSKNDSIGTFLKTDRNKFLNKYFENGRFKSEEFSFIQETAVIYYLFNDGIYCQRDCESGYIFIASKLHEFYKRQQKQKEDGS